MSAGQERAAAIDIGSNTVHLLVGAWRDGRIDPIDDASKLVGLAEDVYAGGALSATRLNEAVDAVAALVGRARSAGARPVALVATAALRDASNAGDLIRTLHDRMGLDLQIIDGEREAVLTYRGASAGEEGRTLQVCDVGGGSTEVIRAEDNHIVLQTSLPLGSSRLSRGLSSDPPPADEVARVYEQARGVLASLSYWQPASTVVTGGTATALAQVVGGDGHRYVMTQDELARVRDMLTRHNAAGIATLHGVEPGRARLLPAGAAIIAALCDTTGSEQMVLTAAGLRDGLLIEYFEGRR